MKSLFTLNKYFYKYKVRLLLGVLFVVVSNYFAVYAVTFLRKGIDYIKGVDVHHPPENLSDMFLYFGLMVVGMSLVQGFFLFLMRQTIIVMSRHIEFDQKNDLYNHYQKLDVSFYKQNRTGDLMNRISEDVGRVRMYIGPSIMYLVNTLMTFVFTIVVMLNISPSLTLYVLLPLPILAISIYYVSDLLNKKGNKVQEQLSKLSSIAQESFSGIRVIKSFGKENQWIKQFEKESNGYKERTMDLVKTDSLFQPLMMLLIGLSTITTIYLGSKQVISGKISMGNIAEFIVYINRLTWPVASLGWVTSLIQRAAASQTRINEFLNTQPLIENNNLAPIKINGSIEFKNVSFTYKDSGIQALKNVSFVIKTGELVAIAGKTGSGKSTLANLICRLYDVDEGEILIDGKNIKEINLYEFRNQIGYVPQEVFLFSDTIANNIAFAQEKKVTHNDIIMAAKNAVIYDNIMSFPDGFETLVGERGITLSGGQKQRVSIARAIIKNPTILMFDDSLSAVDTETEYAIVNNLQTITQNRTSILISHRTTTAKNAAKILVLDNGQLIEEGNHASLMDKKGAYYTIHLLQQSDNKKEL